MATELAKAYVQIVPSTKGFKGQLSEALNGEAASAGTASGKTLGSAMMTAVKGAAIGAGIVSFVKKSIDAGGALQQSFGGLETIYGDASEAAKQYALAASQAGISANDYAEQAVSFGASLKMAFSGDTTKAIEAANTAIMDMTDNAAKMGTPLESIQNAYQGFAKQNYTMLDNLKLGYGGTKTEMERLLSDAEKISGVKYNIENLGDVYDAIHVIQGELGLTGVAADEAASTFTGSMGAMKAAISNFMGALSTGGDVKAPLEMLIGNIKVFVADNFIPMIASIIKSIPEIIVVLGAEFGKALEEVISNMSNVLPDIIAKIQEFIPKITEYISNNLPQIFAFIGNLINLAIQNLPALLGGIIKIIGTILSNLPQLIGALLKSLFSFINELCNGFFSNIIDSIKAFLDRPLYYIGYAIGAIIAKIIQFNNEVLAKIKEFFTETIPNVWEGFKTWLTSRPEEIKGFFINLPEELKNIGRNMIEGLINGIKEKWESLKNGIKDLSRGLVDGFKNTLQIHSPSRVFRDQIGKFIPEGLAEGIKNNIGSVTRAMNDLEDKTLKSISGNNFELGNMAYTAGGIATQPGYNNANEGGVFALLSEYLPQLANMRIVTDTGAMVGALAPGMDAELGRRATMKGRYI